MQNTTNSCGWIDLGWPSGHRRSSLARAILVVDQFSCHSGCYYEGTVAFIVQKHVIVGLTMTGRQFILTLSLVRWLTGGVFGVLVCLVQPETRGSCSFSPSKNEKDSYDINIGKLQRDRSIVTIVAL